jgi:hypothetical protein
MFLIPLPFHVPHYSPSLFLSTSPPPVPRSPSLSSPSVFPLPRPFHVPHYFPSTSMSPSLPLPHSPFLQLPIHVPLAVSASLHSLFCPHSLPYSGTLKKRSRNFSSPKIYLHKTSLGINSYGEKAFLDQNIPSLNLYVLYYQCYGAGAARSCIILVEPEPQRDVTPAPTAPTL